MPQSVVPSLITSSNSTHPTTDDERARLIRQMNDVVNRVLGRSNELQQLLNVARDEGFEISPSLHVAVRRREHATMSPGPWRAIEWACHAPTTVVDVDGHVVAECSGHGRLAEESIDDARVIAALPAILKALKKLTARAREQMHGGMAWQEILDAEEELRRAGRGAR